MQCNEATERFVRHMRECGVESADDSSRPQQQKWMREWIRKITQPNGMGLSEAPGPDFWGYRDRTREGHIHHVVALAEFDGDTYFVDWTASQYYPGTEVEFPVIRKLAGIDPSTKEPKWLPV
jgi:hypothetical protein